MAQQQLKKRLVILDRDGVINQDSSEFVKSADEWLPIDGSIEAIARLSRAGFSVAIASNQSGLARGRFDNDALLAMHQKLDDLVVAAGGRVDRIIICPHGPDDGCDCRKPKPGMLLELGRYFSTALVGVPIIGDSLRDLHAAAAAGAQPVLVRTGNGLTTEQQLPAEFRDIAIFDDLAAAATALAAC
jgi:D-glycero-D-manno-heptose 1,7-bisphosphate phosphatase